MVTTVLAHSLYIAHRWLVSQLLTARHFLAARDCGAALTPGTKSPGVLLCRECSRATIPHAKEIENLGIERSLWQIFLPESEMELHGRCSKRRRDSQREKRDLFVCRNHRSLHSLSRSSIPIPLFNRRSPAICKIALPRYNPSDISCGISYPNDERIQISRGFRAKP